MGIWDGGAATVGGDCSSSSTYVGSSSGGNATGCGCTRRPGAGNSFQCPMGVGEEVTVSIGEGGGTVSLDGRQWQQSGVAAAIDFPPTAVAAPTDITLIETAIAPPRDFLDWSPVYRLEPLGLTLATSAPIRLPWSNGTGGGGAADLSALSIWFSPDGACFTRVPDSYTNAGFEQGSVTRLGYFIVAAQRTAATATCP
jgi:hypothetical protein